jgi:membrane protein
VWLAAAVTITMLSIGAWGYGIYLDAVGLKSASGVAGTLLLGLALIYYSAQILLFGVEVTKEAHARSEHPG